MPRGRSPSPFSFISPHCSSALVFLDLSSPPQYPLFSYFDSGLFNSRAYTWSATNRRRTVLPQSRKRHLQCFCCDPKPGHIASIPLSVHTQLSVLHLMFYTTSSSIEAASVAGQFPNEIVEKILEYAWNDPANDDFPGFFLPSPYRRMRWELFAMVSGTCRQWHAVMHRVCMLNVIIETNVDLARYKSLRARSAGQSKDGRSHETLSLDPVRTRYLRFSVICWSRVCYYEWVDDFEGLFALVQHCRAAELQLLTGDEHSWPLLFDFLRRLTQLTALHMVWVPSDVKECLPDIHVPSVTYLRVNHFPTYAGRPHALPANRERLLGWSVIACFPRLRTLCLDEPTFLKALIPTPPTLTTIVIEAPPLPSGHATIHGWNVAAALNRGLAVPRIVVNTGANEPLGWTQAAAAAAAHGVILERCCTYSDVPPAPPPVQDSGVWYDKPEMRRKHFQTVTAWWEESSFLCYGRG